MAIKLHSLRQTFKLRKVIEKEMLCILQMIYKWMILINWKFVCYTLKWFVLNLFNWSFCLQKKGSLVLDIHNQTFWDVDCVIVIWLYLFY